MRKSRRSLLFALSMAPVVFHSVLWLLFPDGVGRVFVSDQAHQFFYKGLTVLDGGTPVEQFHPGTPVTYLMAVLQLLVEGSVVGSIRNAGTLLHLGRWVLLAGAMGGVYLLIRDVLEDRYHFALVSLLMLYSVPAFWFFIGESYGTNAVIPVFALVTCLLLFSYLVSDAALNAVALGVFSGFAFAVKMSFGFVLAPVFVAIVSPVLLAESRSLNSLPGPDEIRVSRRHRQLLSAAFATTGIVAFSVGVLFSPAFVARTFAPDGALSQVGVLVVQAARAGALLGGILFVGMFALVSRSRTRADWLVRFLRSDHPLSNGIKYGSTFVAGFVAFTIYSMPNYFVIAFELFMNLRSSGSTVFWVPTSPSAIVGFAVILVPVLLLAGLFLVERSLDPLESVHVQLVAFWAASLGVLLLAIPELFRGEAIQAANFINFGPIMLVFTWTTVLLLEELEFSGRILKTDANTTKRSAMLLIVGFYLVTSSAIVVNQYEFSRYEYETGDDVERVIDELRETDGRVAVPRRVHIETSDSSGSLYADSVDTLIYMPGVFFHLNGAFNHGEARFGPEIVSTFPNFTRLNWPWVRQMYDEDLGSDHTDMPYGGNDGLYTGATQNVSVSCLVYQPRRGVPVDLKSQYNVTDEQFRRDLSREAGFADYTAERETYSLAPRAEPLTLVHVCRAP